MSLGKERLRIDMSILRLELRAVIVPLSDRDKERVRISAARTVVAVGTFFDASVRPYEKPSGSFMVRAEADCIGDADQLVGRLVAAVGGVGWITCGSVDEAEAVWASQEGAVPPLAAITTWAHVQAIPVSALPAARREKSAPSLNS